MIPRLELLKIVKAQKDNIQPLVGDVIATLGGWVHPNTIRRALLDGLRDSGSEHAYREITELGYSVADMEKILENARQGKLNHENSSGA